MSGNDTHDKYGRPYELDDGVDKIYDRLEELRQCVRDFHYYLDKELEELDKIPCGINIEASMTREIRENFLERFSRVEY